jgi:hypothetical protein
VVGASRLPGQTKPGPQPTPTAAVQEFMQAASDSNLTAMAALWGTAKGSAAVTGKPADFPKRVIIMQAYLNGIKSRVLSEVPAEKADQRLVTTEIARGACTVTLSVRAVKTKGGWLVQEFDLDQASHVNRPCGNSGG